MKPLSMAFVATAIVFGLDGHYWIAVPLCLMAIMAWPLDYSNVDAEVDEIEEQLRRDEETRGAA